MRYQPFSAEDLFPKCAACGEVIRLDKQCASQGWVHSKCVPTRELSVAEQAFRAQPRNTPLDWLGDLTAEERGVLARYWGPSWEDQDNIEFAAYLARYEQAKGGGRHGVN